MQDIIPNTDLSETNLPPPNADWETIAPFCVTFHGYAYWGSLEKCAEVAGLCERSWEDNKDLPQTLTELRTALFFFQRGWRFAAQGWEDPDEQMMDYLHALIEQMRVKVTAKEFD